MKKTVLRKYAQLIARCGVNVQKGQEVCIPVSYTHLDVYKRQAARIDGESLFIAGCLQKRNL